LDSGADSSSSFVGALGLASVFGLTSGLGFGFKPGFATTFPVSFWISLVASLKMLSKISELSEKGSFSFCLLFFCQPSLKPSPQHTPFAGNNTGFFLAFL